MFINHRIKTMLNVLFLSIPLTYGKYQIIVKINFLRTFDSGEMQCIVINTMKYIKYTLVTGLRCYSCMPEDKNSSEILDCMNSTTDAGKFQKCKHSKDGNACMLTSTGIMFSLALILFKMSLTVVLCCHFSSITIKI